MFVMTVMSVSVCACVLLWQRVACVCVCQVASKEAELEALDVDIAAKALTQRSIDRSANRVATVVRLFCFAAAFPVALSFRSCVRHSSTGYSGLGLPVASLSTRGLRSWSCPGTFPPLLV